MGIMIYLSGAQILPYSSLLMLDHIYCEGKMFFSVLAPAIPRGPF